MHRLGDPSLAVWHKYWLLKKKKASHAAHTSLGCSTARTLCVAAHCPTRPEKAWPFHTKVSTTTLGPDLNPHGRGSLQPRSNKSLEPTFSRNNELRRTFGASSSATNGSLRCSSQSAKSCFVSFPDIVSTRGIVVFFSCVLGCLYSPKGFCFLDFQWLLYPHILLTSVNEKYISSQSSPSMPLCNVWQKAYQSASTRRGPHLSCSLWSTFIRAFDVRALPDYHPQAPLWHCRLSYLKCARAPA